jgi:tRNA 2-thiouridine synthesizing protein E
MTTEYETLYYPEPDQASAGGSRHPWSEAEAARIAREDGLGELGQEHWKVIHTLRQHFIQYGALPPMRYACDVNRLEPHCVERLFHQPREAWRVSGLPDPGEEAMSYLV